MEEKIKEMKKQYAKIQQSVQRSERAARARSHVKCKLAEQTALRNEEEKMKSSENLKKRNSKSSPSTVSSLTDTNSIKGSPSHQKFSKGVSFSFGNEDNLIQKCPSGSEPPESKNSGDIPLKETYNPEQRNSCSILANVESCKGDRVEGNNLQNICLEENSMQNTHLEKEDLTLKETGIKESHESSEKPSQKIATSGRQLRKKQRRSRDMEYLAPSLKESMEFDSCGYTSHTFVDDMPYPAEYYVRRTRSMKWRQWSEKTSDSLAPAGIKEDVDVSSENTADETPNQVSVRELDSPVVDSIQSCLIEDKCNPSVLSSDSEQSQSILQESSTRSGSRISTRRGRKKGLLSGSSEASKTETVSSNISPNLYQSGKLESMCHSAGVSDSAVKRGRRRSKLSRRKVKSCDNSPLDFLQDDSFNIEDFKHPIKNSGIRNKEPVTISHRNINVEESVNTNQLPAVSSDNLPKSIFPKYPHHFHQKCNTDFFLPDSEFVHLKVAKVRNTPVLTKQSTKPSVSDINTASCKVLELESDDGEAVKLVTQQIIEGGTRTNQPNFKDVKFAEDDDKCDFHKVANMAPKIDNPDIVQDPMVTEKPVENLCCRLLDLLCSEGSSALVSEVSSCTSKVNSSTEPCYVNSEPLISSDSDTAGKHEESIEEKLHEENNINVKAVTSIGPELTTESSSNLQELPTVDVNIAGETSKEFLTVDVNIAGGTSTEPLTGDVNIAGVTSKELPTGDASSNDIMERSPSTGDGQQTPVDLLEKYGQLSIGDVTNNVEKTLEEPSTGDVGLLLKLEATGDPANNAEQMNDSDREREKTPVDQLMKDSIGSNVTQESPFSGVATGTPPRPAEIPDANALHGKEDLLEGQAVQFSGCLSHGIDGRIICFDAVICPQHDSVASVVAVCFEKSLVVWSEKIQDGCWEVEATFDLPQLESFDAVCLVYIAGNIWLATSGNLASSSLRLFNLNLDGSHTLQEQPAMASDSCTRGQITALCPVVDDGIAGASYHCQEERSTLFHIPLDIHSSASPTAAIEIGQYMDKVTSVHEVTGTQHWIVALSKDDVILGNLKFGQIVKCIPWTLSFQEAPKCLTVSSEGGLLFLVLGCQGNGAYSRLDVVNPEAGRMSTLLEYRNENKQQSRFVSASADGQHLATRFPYGSIAIFNVYTGQVVVDIEHLGQAHNDIEHQVVAGSASTCVKLLGSRIADKTLLCVAIRNCVHIHEMILNRC